MLGGLWRNLGERVSGLSRRELFGRSGLLAAAGVLPRSAAAAGGGNVYQAIGVRPLINCKGTFTIVSGSLTLPAVKRAMDEASHHYVHLDELMDAVGRRLAQLTGAEWGIVNEPNDPDGFTRRYLLFQPFKDSTYLPIGLKAVKLLKG